MMGVPSIYDVKVRLKVVDKFKDYGPDPVYRCRLRVDDKDANDRGITPRSS